MQRLLRIGLVLSLALVVGVAAPASAACHAFTVSVDPAEVVEGGTVTVTVERDAAVEESSIDVSTVDGTATAGDDYDPLDETADFPDGGTSQSFTVPTSDREGTNGSRSFQVELSNPQGCAVNPNYSVGDPATVTIVDSEEPAEETAPEESPAEETADPTEEAAEVDDQATEPDETLAETGPDAVLLLAALALAALLLGATLRRRAS